MSNRFAQTLTAEPGDIDELGHVNNTVWLRWVQDIATAHWQADAAPEHVARYVWVVLRHEIDYRANVGPGAVVHAETWIPGHPKGARFARCVAFRDTGGKLLAEVISTWAMIDRASLRPVRITPELAAPFLPVAT